jgi:hypothetical protein
MKKLTVLAPSIFFLLFAGLGDSYADHKKNPNAGHGGGGGDDPSGGGKALLFEIDEIKCEPEVSVATSFGQVTWAGNVLWDENNIHVHFKLQLEDVDPGTYEILGNNDGDDLGRACSNDPHTPDFPLPKDCDVDDCLTITVKQNGQGRTSGAVQLPGCDPNKMTTVWVTVVGDEDNPIVLRSTPVTVVLPPNEVGTGLSCPP